MASPVVEAAFDKVPDGYIDGMLVAQMSAELEAATGRGDPEAAEIAFLAVGWVRWFAGRLERMNMLGPTAAISPIVAAGVANVCDVAERAWRDVVRLREAATAASERLPDGDEV